MHVRIAYSYVIILHIIYIFIFLKNDEELKCVTEQQENKLQEKIPEEKESFHGDHLIHRDVKNVPKVLIKQKSRHVKVTPSKNELGGQEKQKSVRTRRNSLKDILKKQRKKKCKDQAADQGSANDQLGKDDRKSNNMDQQPSNNDDQGGKNNERRDSNIGKRQSKKVQYVF